MRRPRRLRCAPTLAEYHFHLAHILLLQGNLLAGWTEYDWRWQLPDFAWISNLHGKFSQPLWAGEDIHDKTILIYTEQGLGNMILFARYLPLVVRRARRVIAAVSPHMRRLLRSIDGVEFVSIRDVPLPRFDVHCPLLKSASCVCDPARRYTITDALLVCRPRSAGALGQPDQARPDRNQHLEGRPCLGW